MVQKKRPPNEKQAGKSKVGRYWESSGGLKEEIEAYLLRGGKKNAIGEVFDKARHNQ